LSLSEFKIVDVTESPEVFPEQMGSKDKFWIEYEDEYWLFKVPRAGTGEHWYILAKPPGQRVG